jgi:hypothetical protein
MFILSAPNPIPAVPRTKTRAIDKTTVRNKMEFFIRKPPSWIPVHPDQADIPDNKINAATHSRD